MTIEICCEAVGMIGRRACAQADDLVAVVRGIKDLSHQACPTGASGGPMLFDEATDAVLTEFSRRVETKRAVLDDVGERIVRSAVAFEQAEAENAQLARALLRGML